MALGDEERAEVSELVREEIRRVARAALVEAEPRTDEVALDGDAPGEDPAAPTGAADHATVERPGPVSPSGDVIARRIGFPPHALLSSIPLGALACSLVFDVAAHAAPEPYTYPRSSYWLLVIGLVGGVIAGVTGAIDQRRLDPGSRTSAAGVRHLVLTEVALVGYVVSFALRRQTDFVDEVPLGIVALSAASFVLLVVGAGLGARLTYQRGVGQRPQANDGTAESDCL